MQPGYPGSGQDPYGQQQPPQSDPYAQPQYPPPPQYPQQPSYQDPYAQQQPYADPYAQPQPISANPYPTSPAYPAAPQYPVAGYGAPVAPPTQTSSNALGLISMILGIIAIPVSCCGVLSFILTIPAIVLGILGIKKANEGQANNKGMAMAGLICGGVAAVIALGWIIFGAAVNLSNLTNN
jgi:hypothetical protein